MNCKTAQMRFPSHQSTETMFQLNSNSLYQHLVGYMNEWVNNTQEAMLNQLLQWCGNKPTSVQGLLEPSVWDLRLKIHAVLESTCRDGESYIRQELWRIESESTVWGSYEAVLHLQNQLRLSLCHISESLQEQILLEQGRLTLRYAAHSIEPMLSQILAFETDMIDR